MASRCAFLAVFLVACGAGGGGDDDGARIDAAVDAPLDADPSGVSPNDGDHSGSRLKRRLFVTADGFAHQVGWHDTTLDFDCEFMTAGDGQIRCGPTQYESVRLFRDTACTDPVFPLPAAVPAGTHVRVFPSTGCQLGVVRVTQQVTTPATVYANFPSGCAAATATGVYHEATDVAAAELVVDVPASQPLSARFAETFRTTGDGARQYLSLYDSDFSESCVSRVLPDGDVHCAPLSGVHANPIFFQDAACSRPVYTYTTCSSSHRYQLERLDPPATCGRRWRVQSLQLYIDDVYRLAGPSCLSATRVADVDYMRESGIWDSEPFAREERRTYTAGTSRLRTRLSYYEGGIVAPSFNELGRVHWDTRHQVECRIEMADGMLRCIPAEFLQVSSNVYEDAACTKPLAENADACDEPYRPAFAGRSGSSVFYRITGAYTGLNVYMRNGPSCVSISRPASPRFFTIEATPTSDWDVGTYIVEN